MTQVKKVGLMHLILAGAIVVAMLGWGTYASLSTYPNDPSTTVNAALQAVHSEVQILGFNIVPGSEGRYTVFFQTTVPASSTPGSYGSSENAAFGPVLWTTPNSTFSEYQVVYVVFIVEYSIVTNSGAVGPQIYYNGPQGNLAASAFMSTSVSPSSGISILKAPSPGNYTLHLSNTNNQNANFTGTVSFGPSIVTYSRPYLYYGLITIGLAGAFTCTAAYVSWKKYQSTKTRTEGRHDP